MESELVDSILAFVDSGADADDLFETAVSVDSPDLYRRCVDVFGAWDAALAAALVASRRTSVAKPERGVALEDAPRPERAVGPAAHVPVYLVGRSGHFLHADLDALRATETPTLRDFPEGPGDGHRPELVIPGVDDFGVALITTHGNALAADLRTLPEWERDAVTRDLSHRFGGLEDDEVVAYAVPRRHLREFDRYYSVSVDGQVKASDCSELARLCNDAMVATLLRDGDALLSIFAAPKATRVFVASSMAKAIVFKTGDIRSQGRRATGVRAIGLDAGARVVGAFAVREATHCVLATEQGLMKRMHLDEFRPQGRGGGGLQTCRLAAGDAVASVAPACLDDDVLVLTSEGRFARFPAYDVPLGNRAARGEPIVPLAPGETVTQVVGAPAGNWV